jgi:hypothetical protein
MADGAFVAGAAATVLLRVFSYSIPEPSFRGTVERSPCSPPKNSRLRPQSEGALLELVAPLPVVRDCRPDMPRKTLTRWKQVGFFASDANGVTAFSPVLAPENSPAFSISGDDDQRRRRVEPTPFVNDTPWGGLSEWIAFLGAALTGPKIGLVPKSFFHRTACSRLGVCATMAEPTFQRGLT